MEHGGVDAGAKAFDFGEGEEVVWGGVARVDAQVGGDGFHDFIGAAAAELAGGLWLDLVLVLGNMGGEGGR